jgi:hypothetical protein
MRPVAVIPMNDPAGIFFPLLQTITPSLKQIFERVFMSVTAVTHENFPQHVAWAQTESLFDVIIHDREASFGYDFVTIMAHAAQSCTPAQILHLCFIDRVFFALQTEYRQSFVADVEGLTPEQTPLIFERSPTAWETHPQNYYHFEQMIRTTGEWLLGQSLDFAWCHLVIQANRLQSIVPMVTQTEGFGFFAELVLLMREDVKTKAVDWLAWEDPFLLNRDAQELKREREQSTAESLKRLAYVTEMMEVLQTAVLEENV